MLKASMLFNIAMNFFPISVSAAHLLLACGALALLLRSDPTRKHGPLAVDEIFQAEVRDADAIAAEIDLPIPILGGVFDVPSSEGDPLLESERPTRREILQFTRIEGPHEPSVPVEGVVRG